MDQHKQFYETQYNGVNYARVSVAEKHSFYPTLKAFIDNYDLHNKRCLEIGCGRGAFQNMVTDYTGVDIAESVRIHMHKPFYRASATHLPFDDSSFDAIWSYATLEHVPNPGKALEEMRRVLKPGGYLLLSPAWQCRSWAANGYPVRPYCDFNVWGKLIKASVPIRNSILFRALHIFPLRVIALLNYFVDQKSTRLHYKVLVPNYETYWMPDSDAINSIDPFYVILWFQSRNDQCLSHPTWHHRFWIRTGHLIIRKHH